MAAPVHRAVGCSPWIEGLVLLEALPEHLFAHRSKKGLSGDFFYEL